MPTPTYACPMSPTGTPVNSCSSIGGIKTITVAGTTITCWSEKSHAESVYAFDKGTGAGVWTTSVYLWLNGASAANRAFLNSLAGQGDITLETVQGDTWTVNGVYMTGANLNTGTAATDGNNADATFTATSKDAPEITAPSA